MDPKIHSGKVLKKCSIFLWTGNKDQKVLPWVKWDKIARPKYLGGWGLKGTALFAKDLEAKEVWRLITMKSLWTEAVYIST